VTRRDDQVGGRDHGVRRTGARERHSPAEPLRCEQRLERCALLTIADDDPMPGQVAQTRLRQGAGEAVEAFAPADAGDGQQAHRSGSPFYRRLGLTEQRWKRRCVAHELDSIPGE
jgi:hypothetical protein